MCLKGQFCKLGKWSTCGLAHLKTPSRRHKQLQWLIFLCEIQDNDIRKILRGAFEHLRYSPGQGNMTETF